VATNANIALTINVIIASTSNEDKVINESNNTKAPINIYGISFANQSNISLITIVTMLIENDFKRYRYCYYAPA
jgi:hypothetical protein